MDSLTLNCAECGGQLAYAEHAHIYVFEIVAYCGDCDKRIRAMTELRVAPEAEIAIKLATGA